MPLRAPRQSGRILGLGVDHLEAGVRKRLFFRLTQDVGATMEIASELASLGVKVSDTHLTHRATSYPFASIKHVGYYAAQTAQMSGEHVRSGVDQLVSPNRVEEDLRWIF